MARADRRRYEAIGWAIARRTFRSLGIFVATVAAVLAAYLFVVLPAIGPVVATIPLPEIARILIALLPFLLLIAVLPSYVVAWTTSADEKAGLETLTAHALLDRRRWISSTGTRPRMGFLTPGAAKAWIAKHPGIDPIQRARVLIWGGDYEDAEAVIARLPHDDAVWQAHRVALIALLRFVRDDDRLTDLLAGAQAEVAALPASTDRDYALLTLAFERARLDLAAGHPFVPGLARARETLGQLPEGASYGERMRSGMRSSAVLITVVALLTAFVRL